MENLQLTLGKMSSKQLAQWFGIAQKTYSNNIKKYLKKLKSYAGFTEVYGGVVINEIFCAEYSKSSDKDSKVFNAEVDRCVKEQNGLLSLAGVARKLVASDKDYAGLQPDTIARRMSVVAKEDYGDYWCSLKGVAKDFAGAKGARERVWALKLSDYNDYRLMTKEEEQLWFQILEKWNSYKNGAQIAEERKLFRDLKKKNIDTEKFIYKMEELEVQHSFYDVIAEFTVLTGLRPVLIARYELGDFKNTDNVPFKLAATGNFQWDDDE